MSTRVNMARWKPHLRAAQRQGKSLAQYAREHDLSPYSLYAARQMLLAGAPRARSQPGPRLQSRPPLRPPLPTPSGFTAVKLLTTPAYASPLPGTAPSLRARLPNGIALELSCGGTDSALLKTMIDALTGWPCSSSTPR